MTATVRVKIRSVNGMAQSTGVVIESNRDRCCPMLRPDEVIEVPEDHPIAQHPVTELTREPATRPVRFASQVDAIAAQSGSPEEQATALERYMLTSAAVSQKKQEAEQRQQQQQQAGYDPGSNIADLSSMLVDDVGGGQSDNQHVRGEIEQEALAAVNAPAEGEAQPRRTVRRQRRNG